MLSYASVITALVAGVSAIPYASPMDRMRAENPNFDLTRRQEITPNEEGTHDGYFFSWWSDGASPVTYTNLEGGSYSVEWQSGGNLVGGKGWNPGGPKEITYSGTWEPENNGNSYLTIYGWTRNPLVEYYIVDAHGDYNPGSAGESRGSVETADGTYELYESTRTEQPSIDGPATFQQYWAIRTENRIGGTVDTSVFFDAWEGAGMTLGEHYYMIVATEAYQSAGSSSITIETSA